MLYEPSLLAARLTVDLLGPGPVHPAEGVPVAVPVTGGSPVRPVHALHTVHSHCTGTATGTATAHCVLAPITEGSKMESEEKNANLAL